MINDVQKANQILALKTAEINCCHRPGFHISPPAGWLNDPNGLCFHNGTYHAFYQHHPFSENWGPMHWGHVTSTDMVHWQHQSVALAPGEEGACFSGSAVSDGEQLALFYTGSIWLGEEGDDSQMRQVQCLATSRDGLIFEKQGIVMPLPPKNGMIHFRDPKVWREENRWHMVVGMRDGETGQIGYYQSDDLHEWSFISVLAEADKSMGFMWECPDFFSMAGKQVLICSPQGMQASGYDNRSLFQNGYMVGQFDKEQGTFTFDKFEELDHGHDFYALQTFTAADGRRVGIAWMDMWESNMPTQKKGWAGALTLPRELQLDADNKLRQIPVVELQSLRCEKLNPVCRKSINNEVQFIGIQEEMLELKICFSLAQAGAERFGLMLRCGETPFEQTLIGYDAMAGRVFIDRNLSGQNMQGVRSAAVDALDGVIELHIFLDRSSVEIFVNQGEAALTSRIYPSQSSLDVKVFAENGRVDIEQFSAWRLQDIWNK
ncbi:glycoside hydrolase family 32 protein [Psychromonas ossibalaenae]|uniref:glycoside hydrolase family 32 protein n=1 Tax=Psychromonas ossibalaenae TaxID=444922 RepID=UPI00037CAE00|nr:glycoside hydrolase family 32 protein [Psychromonas ossibalaenae]